MTFGLFGIDCDDGRDDDPRRRLARLAGLVEPVPASATDLAELVDLPPPEPAGETDRASPRPDAGRKVRRWLPAGPTAARLDPGRRAAVVLAAVVLLAGFVAGFALWRSRPVAEPLPAALPAVAGPATTSASTEELVVSVAGLVAKPGLVQLPPGARVADAVEAAGGVRPGTDLTMINLARRLADGEHVVIDPDVVPAPGVVLPGMPADGNGASVNLNTATLDELETLPGVGPVTAQSILAWRAAHGQFSSLDQLREVDGIGEARLAKLRDLVTI